jgi:hypothetical protein
MVGVLINKETRFPSSLHILHNFMLLDEKKFLATDTKEIHC